MRALLLMTPTTYRATDFLRAGAAAGIEVVVATPVPQALAGGAPAHNLTLPFQQPEEAACQAAEFAVRHPLDAVLGVDDEGVVPAAAIAAALGLRHHSLAAAAATRDKAWMRRRLREGGVPSPAHVECDAPGDAWRARQALRPPWVAKPVGLSASRGVIRANTPEELDQALARIFALLEREAAAGREAPSRALVEEYIPGVEVALEGLVTGGRLRTLALFDKPDPLEGPTFPETLYITPSRLSEEVQEGVRRAAAAAARALDLDEGPVHAELRINDAGIWMVEIAARTIGGLCSRTLRFGTGMSLEEIILRHACGLPLPSLSRERSAAGVLMLHVSKPGLLERVDGVEEARAEPGIEGVEITIPPGQEVEPLPDGNRYLGFVFARGNGPADVEAALRRAHRRLRARIRPLRA